MHDGHAPGHGAVFLPESGVLIAGDMCSDVEIPLLDTDAADRSATIAPGWSGWRPHPASARSYPATGISGTQPSSAGDSPWTLPT